LVGDSFVFGIGVDDAATLQCLLNESVSTYAMGIPGAGPTEYRRMIGQQFRAMVSHGLVSKDADVIVVLFSGNDFEGLLLDEPKGVAEPNPPVHVEARDAPPGRVLQRVNQFVFHDWPSKESYFLTLIKMALVSQAGRGSKSADVLRLNTDSTLYRTRAAIERRSEFIERAAWYFRAMEELRRAFGISALSYLVVPDVNEIDPELVKSSLSAYAEQPANFTLAFKRDVLVEAARRADVRLVDAYGCFGENGANTFYYVLDNHLNARGTRRLVECVRDRLPP
jgi:hypothetical protein